MNRRIERSQGDACEAYIHDDVCATRVINAQTNGLCPQYSFNAANNQITGYTYDAAGNTTNDGTYTYQWDAEGRLSQSLQSSTVMHAYTYNALGQRAEDIPGGGYAPQEWVYDPSGQVLGNLFTAGWWHITVPALGRIFENTEDWYLGAAWIYHYNALGSALAATYGNGAPALDTQYYPWGQEWLNADGQWSTGIFAGLLSFQCQLAPCPDQSQSRDYPPTLGRWLSPDPEGGDVTNPQSLNRYAYVLNNPTSLTDVLGLDHANCSNPAIAAKDPTCQEGPGASSSDVNSDEFALINITVYSDWYWGGEGEWISSPLGNALEFLFGAGGTGGGGDGLAVLPLPPLSQQTIQGLLPSCLQVTGQSIDSYLADKGSPMLGQGNNFVSNGLQYGVDPRFLVALAGAETTFGAKLTWGAYNAWNWGWNSPKNNSPFSSWGAGIHSVARGIGAGPNYFRRGFTSTASIYLGHFCVGPECATEGLPNLNNFLTEMGGDPGNVTCH